MAAPVLVPIGLGFVTDATAAQAGSVVPGDSSSGGPGSASSGQPGASGSPAPGASDSSSDPVEPSSADPTGAPLDPDAVEAALAPLLTGGALGPGRSPAHVIDVATGEVLYDASDDPTVPASTMKLVTATSVLDALGTDARLRTRVVVVDPAAKTPRVVIIGAGDPSLRSTGAKVGGPGPA